MNPEDIVFELGSSVDDPITRMGQVLTVQNAGLVGSFRDSTLALAIKGLSPDGRSSTVRVQYDASRNSHVRPKEQQFLRITHTLQHGTWVSLTDEEKQAATFVIQKVNWGGGGTEYGILDLAPQPVEQEVVYSVSLSSYSIMSTD